MKTLIGMLCITALGVTHLIVVGDGTILAAAITAVSGLAGATVGFEIGKATQKQD